MMLAKTMAKHHIISINGSFVEDIVHWQELKGLSQLAHD